MSASSSSSSKSAASSSSSIGGLPKKKARIFSNGSAHRQRAVVFNATNYFNGDSANEDFSFNEPIAPVYNQPQDTPKARKAHQCHESGESNQMNNDIDYYIDSLNRNCKNDIRCLSLLGLAKKLMSVEFRMHLRAHEVMPKILDLLTDANDDPSLALSCATLMFIHNQDKTSLDIDPTALKLMLNIINGNHETVHSTELVEKKHKATVIELLNQMKDKGLAKNIQVDRITAAKLATETLLGLNVKMTRDWFKDELRQLKGIDFVIDTISQIAETEDLESKVDELNKLDRCMHLLENITFQNRNNQDYIIKYNDNIFIDACLEILALCKRVLTVSDDDDEQFKLFSSTLSSTIKALNNITSESKSSSIVGSRYELTDLLLYFINELEAFLKPKQKSSDRTMICICLLINMVELNEQLRSKLMNDSSSMQNLIETFYKRIKEAQNTEQEADDILNMKNKKEKMTEALQDTLINDVIAKSGKHMEHTVIAACLAILFGCLIQDNPNFKSHLLTYLKEDSVAPLIDVLQKLHDFAHLADIMTSTGVNRVKRIIRVLKKKDDTNDDDL